MNKGALWNTIQVALDVSVNYPPTSQEHFVNCADCLRSTALWPKPIRVILEISFEDWFDYYPTRLLDDSVADRRDGQRELHCTTASIWDGRRFFIPFIRCAVSASRYSRRDV